MDELRMPTPPGEKGLTHTHRIYETLKRSKHDFMNVAQLVEATGANYNQATAALFKLREYQAVDVVINGDGTGWWFATPETDLRGRRVVERKVEEPGTRRTRKGPRKFNRVVVPFKQRGEPQ